jgi:hypothetical protein
MNIIKIEPVWNLKWANDPDIKVYVDAPYPRDVWEWQKIPADTDKNFMLLSTNYDPWVKFVYIADPSFDAIRGGALGGEYKLTNGEVLKSRSGWSSRAGVINRDYINLLADEIVDVILMTPEYKTGLAGMNIYYKDLVSHPCWPEGLHLVRKLWNKEPVWTISTDPRKVVKPDGEVS